MANQVSSDDVLGFQAPKTVSVIKDNKAKEFAKALQKKTCWL